MIINNTDYLYSQHWHDHIDENQHDNPNRSSWSATYWWSGGFRERPRASDSQKEFQETIRWLNTMVKIRNYSQKFGEDVPENTPAPRHANLGNFFTFAFPPQKKSRVNLDMPSAPCNTLFDTSKIQQVGRETWLGWGGLWEAEGGQLGVGCHLKSRIVFRPEDLTPTAFMYEESKTPIARL